MNITTTRRGWMALASLTICGLAATGCSVTGVSGGGQSGSGKGTIHALFMKQAGYTEDDYAAIIAAFEEDNPDITVDPTFVSYEALHDKIVTSAPAGSYDVVLIDVIWPAEFASKGIIADVTDRFSDDWKKDMLPGVVPTAQYQGKFYGVPNGPATKLFFFNKDMVAKVGANEAELASWDGVLDVARKIKAAGLSEYPIAWSWAQAEALICDYAQMLGAFGGSFTDDQGNLVINQQEGVQALEWMKQTLDEGLSNPASTTFLEDDVAKALAQGQTAFGLNWDSTLRDLKDPSISTIDAGVQATPTGPGGANPGVNGSMAYAIGANSKNMDAAWSFISYITSPDVQNQYVSSSLPNWSASYSDPEIVKTDPDLFAVAQDAYASSILRPTVENYSSASQIIQVELQNALLGKKGAQQAMDDAVAAVDALKEQ